jgi:hypothetical protein
MHERMNRTDLWKAVRRRDGRWHDVSPSVRLTRTAVGAAPSPAFQVELRDTDGNMHPAIVVKALTAVESTMVTRHGAYGQLEAVRTRTSKLVMGGFRVSTLGGTVNIDVAGRGVAKLADGTQVELELHAHLRVLITAAGPIDVAGLPDQQLAMLAREAMKADAELTQQLAELADANREWLV